MTRNVVPSTALQDKDMLLLDLEQSPECITRSPT